MRPTGAIGFSRPPRGLHGLIGRLICGRQALFIRDSLVPGQGRFATSHVRRALGDGRIAEQTMPHWRIRTESEDAADNPEGVVWFAPPYEWTDVERQKLIAAAEALALAGGHYGIRALFRFLVIGTLGLAGWVCTNGAALLGWVAVGEDVSGCRQPQNVDLRTWISAVHNGNWRRLP